MAAVVASDGWLVEGRSVIWIYQGYCGSCKIFTHWQTLACPWVRERCGREICRLASQSHNLVYPFLYSKHSVTESYRSIIACSSRWIYCMPGLYIRLASSFSRQRSACIGYGADVGNCGTNASLCFSSWALPWNRVNRLSPSSCSAPVNSSCPLRGV